MKQIYDVIFKAGSKGLTHDEIIKKCETKSFQSPKMTGYLSSHYCIKLKKLGLVS